MRLDSRTTLPEGLEDYLSMYGWHFSKKLCDWAVSKMKLNNGNPITPYTKEVVDDLINKYSMKIDNLWGYDYVYVANMAKADYLGSSIPDEAHLVKFLRDYLDDPDGYDELPMSRFYADIVAKGIPIIWEDML